MRNESQCRSLASATSLRTVVAALVLAIMLMLGNSAVAQGKQLMAPGVGWASSGGALYWTTDNGKQWKNITPPLHNYGIVSVFFLDTSTGWVLGSTGGVPAEFEFAFTHDSGSSWSITHLDLPVDMNFTEFIGQGDIQFLDETHGWMNLALQSGAAYDSGLLFRTEDGGKHWTLSKSPGKAGDLRFIDEHNGWTRNFRRSELWATHDGGLTWSQVFLKPPAQMYPSNEAEYQLPLFSDKKDGDVVVTFSASATAPDADSAGSEVVLFATSDTGRSWSFKTALTHLPVRNEDFAADLADSALVAAYPADPAGTKLTLAYIPLGRLEDATAVSTNTGYPGVGSISSVDQQRSWILVGGALLSTTDAGASWADITPGRGKVEKPQRPAGNPIPLDWKPGGWKRPVAFSASNGPIPSMSN